MKRARSGKPEKRGTQGTQDDGRLIPFPAERTEAALQAQRLDASRDALASAITIAESVYGVSVVWTTPRDDDLDNANNVTIGAIGNAGNAHSAALLTIATGDPSARRLFLSRAGLNRLKDLKRLKRQGADALDAAARFLAAQANATLSIAARMGTMGAMGIGAAALTASATAPHGPRGTVELVVALLAASGLCHIITLPSAPDRPGIVHTVSAADAPNAPGEAAGAGQ